MSEQKPLIKLLENPNLSAFLARPFRKILEKLAQEEANGNDN